MKKRILILSLALFTAGLFVSENLSYAEEKTYREENIVYSCTLYESFLFRHNRNGFWYATNNSGSAIIYDEQAASGGRLSCAGSVNALYMLPGEVVKALQKDSGLRARIEHPGIPSCIDFGFFAYYFPGPSTISMEFRLVPTTSSSYFLNSFVQGLDTVIPLVDYNYGKNIYTVYTALGGEQLAPGFFSDNDPSWISSPLIHPSQIKNRYGEFVPGTIINADGINKDALFYTVGRRNVLELEDAVLLHFNCPVKLIFYYPGEGDENRPQYPAGHSFIDPWEVHREEPKAEEIKILRLHRKR